MKIHDIVYSKSKQTAHYKKLDSYEASIEKRKPFS